MDQLVFGSSLVVILLALAGYYAWRQRQALRGLREADDVPLEDRRYARRMAWRRLVGSGLMAVFAGMLVGSFFLQSHWHRLEEKRKAALDQAGALAASTAGLIGAPLGQGPALAAAALLPGRTAGLTDAERNRQRAFDLLYSSYWLVALLVVLGILSLAAVDFWAIRRFGLRHFRQIQADRRAMLEDQIARFRRQRNGRS